MFNNSGGRKRNGPNSMSRSGDSRWSLSGSKKKLPATIEARRAMIDRDLAMFSIRRQCELISLNRSSLYYQPAGESEENLRLMHLLDRQYTKTPFYGWPGVARLRRRE